jgi:hypothetical protein
MTEVKKENWRRIGDYPILTHFVPLEITGKFSEKVEVAVYLVNFNQSPLVKPK